MDNRGPGDRQAVVEIGHVESPEVDGFATAGDADRAPRAGGPTGGGEDAVDLPALPIGQSLGSRRTGERERRQAGPPHPRCDTITPLGTQAPVI